MSDRSAVLGQANRVLDRCGSTNDVARALGEAGAPHGTWVSARAQDQGRGRLGRQWQSLEGNLFLSVIARIEDKSVWTWIPLTAAIGAARYLKSRYPGLPLAIKWPNDLWIRGAKLGGLLCEAVGGRDGSFVIIGLGMNCAHAPEGLDQATVSLSGCLWPERVTADDVREGVVSAVVSALDELASKGPAGIVRDYGAWAAFPPGTKIEWTHPSDAAAAPGTGMVQGLGPSGELVVEAEGGQGTLKLYAEDVRVRTPKASGGSPA